MPSTDDRLTGIERSIVRQRRWLVALSLILVVVAVSQAVLEFESSDGPGKGGGTVDGQLGAVGSAPTAQALALKGFSWDGINANSESEARRHIEEWAEQTGVVIGSCESSSDAQFANLPVSARRQWECFSKDGVFIGAWVWREGKGQPLVQFTFDFLGVSGYRMEELAALLADRFAVDMRGEGPRFVDGRGWIPEAWTGTGACGQTVVIGGFASGVRLQAQRVLAEPDFE